MEYILPKDFKEGMYVKDYKILKEIGRG